MTVYQPPAGHQRLKLHLAWDGKGFVGWQSQPVQRSVQETLHEALNTLMQSARPVAAGRTDSGVHAQDMCVHVDALAGSVRPVLGQLARALNTRLPADVAVLRAELAPPGFHARFSCLQRQYIYRVLHAPQRHPLYEGRALHVPQPLNLEAMQRAAPLLLGCHDFAAFATQEERQTVRELYRLEIVQRGDLLEFHVAGESFLRHMVRGLVGTLLDVGLERRADVQDILASRTRQRAGANVAACGLYFTGAVYPPDISQL